MNRLFIFVAFLLDVDSALCFLSYVRPLFEVLRFSKISYINILIVVILIATIRTGLLYQSAFATPSTRL